MSPAASQNEPRNPAAPAPIHGDTRSCAEGEVDAGWLLSWWPTTSEMTARHVPTPATANETVAIVARPFADSYDE
jgi:hypothetical protein